MTKTALITGVTGQDGAHISRLLLQKGYRVVGGRRRSAGPTCWRLDELGITKDIELMSLEMLEGANIRKVVRAVKPDEVYNLAAQSFVKDSTECPEYTANADALGAMRLLEVLREECPNTRFYQASTSEMFGKVHETPQNEDTPFHPRSPYSVSKLFAHWTAINYREAYGMHTTCGILFNHEGPFRGEEFVTRKITTSLARLHYDYTAPPMELGNMDASRDWGYAGDYVEGMHLMLQQPTGGVYVLATGVTTTVRRFVEMSAKAAGFTLGWEGMRVFEKGVDLKTGRVLVTINPAFYRPAETDLLLGDATLAGKVLGWHPKTSVEELAGMMVEADLRRTVAR